MSKFQTKTVLNAGNVAGNLVSDVLDLRYNYGFAAQAKLTGSPTGTVIIEGTNDDPALSSAVWSQIDSLAVSGTTTLFSNKDAIYWPYIRARKDAGGTGTLTVKITIKGA